MRRSRRWSTSTATHFDPALRDQVVARYAKLNVPTYWCGVNADLTAKLDAAGKVTSVSISYPSDVVKQQLSYAQCTDYNNRRLHGCAS